MGNDDLYNAQCTYYSRSFLKKPVPGYKFYDTPDGEDLLRKLWLSSKIGAYLGFLIAGYDSIVRYSPAKGSWIWFQIVRRSVPFVLSPVVYTVTTYSLAHIRKKDDILNANIGGAVAGLTFGIWCRKGSVALIGAIIGSIGCELKKRSAMAGIEFPFSHVPQMMFSSWTLRNLDFTLTEEIKDVKPRY